MAKCEIGNLKKSSIQNFATSIKKFLDNYAKEEDQVLALKVARLELDEAQGIIFDEAVKVLYAEDQAILEDYVDPSIEIPDDDIVSFDYKVNVAERLVTEVGLGNIEDAFAETDEDESDIGEDSASRKKSPGINLGQADQGSRIFDGFYIIAIGQRISRSDLKNMLNKIKSAVNFESFKNWIEKTYSLKDRFSDSTLLGSARKRALRLFYIGNRAVNKVASETKNRLIYTNLDPSVEITDDKTLISAITKNAKAFIRKLPFNLKQKTKTPDNEVASFIDTGDRKIRNVLVSKITGSFSLNEMVKVIKYKKSWFSVPAVSSKNVSKSTISEWAYKFLNRRAANGMRAPQVIVGMTPGDTGSIFVTRILPAQLEEIFNMSNILSKDSAFMRSLIQSKIPNKFVAEIRRVLKNNNGNIIEVLSQLDDKMQKMSKDNVYTSYQRENIFSELNKVVRDYAKDGFLTYLNKQYAQGLMTKEHGKMILDSAFNQVTKSKTSGRVALFPLHAVGVIAKHEWFQAVRGKNYLMGNKGDNAFNIFDRLRLNNSKGLQTEEMGESTHLTYDQDKVEFWYKGKKYEHLRDIKGIKGLTNTIDGGSFSSTSYLDDTAENIGVNKIYDNERNLREVKSVYTETTVDDKTGNESYIEKKHAEHVAIDGLEIRNKTESGKKGKLIVEMKKMGNQIMMIHKPSQGETVYLDQISDLDVVKTRTGSYKLNGASYSSPFTLKESSRRIIITPHVRSSNDVFGPTQYLQSLNMNLKNKTNKKMFDDYVKTITDIVLGQSNLYVDKYFDVSQSPESLWNVVKYMFSEQSDVKTGLQNHLIASGGAGIFHINNLMQLRPMILNKLIRRGSMQGRTYNNKLGKKKEALAGSKFIMKPGREVNRGSVIVSKENHVIWDAVVKETGLTNPSIQEVNEWLKDNPQHVITYRAPILQVSALESRTIQEFTEDEGDAIYHHPEDTTVRLVGDHDIDSAGVILIKEEDANKLNAFYDSPLFQDLKTTNADIGIFKKGPNLSILSNEDTNQAMVDIINAHGAQGMAANLKSIASALSVKFGKINMHQVIDDKVNPNANLVVEPKQLYSDDTKGNDLVVMDYIELEDNTTENDIPPFASIVDKDGNPWVNKSKSGPKFLKTSAEHEFLLIANAAVDNLKSGLLTNGMGARNSDWFVKRMFKFVKGEPTSEHIRLLKALKDRYNYSKLRKMRTEKGNKMGTERFFDELKQIYENREMSAKEQADEIRDTLRYSDTLFFKKKGKGANLDIAFGDIEMFKNITPEEKIILNPYIKLLELWEKNGNDSEFLPLMFGEARLELVHHMASEKLTQFVVDNFAFTSDIAEQAQNLAFSFADTFFGEFDTLKESKKNQESKESEVINKQAEFDERLFDITLDYEQRIAKKVEEFGEDFSIAFTLNMLTGVGNRQNVKYLPPVEVLNKGLFKEYMELWDKAFFARDKEGNLLSTQTQSVLKETYKGQGSMAVTMLDHVKKTERRDC